MDENAASPMEPVAVGAPGHAAAVGAPRRGHGWIWAVVIGCLVIGVLASCGLLAASTMGDGVAGAGAGQRVALIHIDDVISGTGGSGSITPERLTALLKRAQSDRSVKAVLLRIDSPGGTASASTEIALEVARFSKPVVASIGDVGASGAYMVAAQCDRIIATPSSAVGSIGVIQEFPNVRKLMDKVGVDVTVIAQGEFKDAGSMYRSLTASETAMLRKQTGLVYDRFIADVAKGRDMPEAKVRELATGWVWTGDEAVKLGLVDEVGTYSDAVRVAGKLGGIKGEPEIVSYDEESLTDIFQQILGAVSALRGPLTGSSSSLSSPPVIR